MSEASNQRLAAVVATEPESSHELERFGDTVASHGGTLVGDGVGVFSTVREAIACAVDLPGGGVAVHAGDVAEIDGQVVGEGVITAAALRAAVPAEEVWCTAAVRSLAGRLPGVTFRSRPAIAAHPSEPALEIAVVVRTAMGGGAGPRSALAGRQRELDQAEHQLRRALAGRGGGLIITGEPGVGKTRLAQELTASAVAHGASVLTGRCGVAGSSPYQPFVEMLDELLTNTPPERTLDVLGEDAPQLAKMMPRLRMLYPEIAAALQVNPDVEPGLLAEAVLRFFTRLARIRPLLLVIDDLQWADEASISLLGQLAARVAEAPVLLVVTARDDEVDLHAPCWQLAEELLRRRVAERVALRPLAPGGVTEMLEGLMGQPPPPTLADAVWGTTEGNPFFVEEVYRDLDEQGRLFDVGERLQASRAAPDTDVPDTVRLTLHRRLDRLGRDATTVLVAAAVIGREFPVRLLGALREVSDEVLVDVLDQADRAGLITSTGDGTRFAFAHELVRQTLLSGVSTIRRQHLHGRVADAIIRMAREPHDHAMEIAHHLLEAGDAADRDEHDVAGYLLVAGNRALDAAAYADACRYFDRALDAPASDQETTVPLLLGRGTARHGVGDWRGALDDWHAALDAYEALGDGEAVANVAARIMRRMTASGRLADALDIGARALALPAAQGPARIRVRALTARVQGLAGDHDAAAELLEHALTDAAALGDHHLEGEVLAQKGMLHWTHMEIAAVVDAAKRAVELCGHGGDQWALSEAMWELLGGLVLAGRLDEARAVDADLGPVVAATGNTIARYATSVLRAVVAFADGDLDGAESSAKETIDFSERAGLPWGSIGHGHLGWVELWRGRLGAALDHFEEADRGAAPGFYRGADRGVLARGLTECGDRGRALALVASLRDDGLLPKGGGAAPMGTWSALVSAVEVLVVLRERQQAGRLYPLVAEGLATGAVLDMWGGRLLERIAGMAAAAADRWDLAEEHFEAALAQAAALPHRIEQPEVRVAYAAMLVRRDEPGDRERARVLAAEAVEQYHALGIGNRAGLAHHIVWAYTDAARVSREGDRSAARTTFRREGDVWSISFGGRVARVRDVKGMHHVARLLREPGREVHALELAGGAGGLVLGDAGPELDATAKATYRRRLGDLAEDLEEAEAFNDVERAAKIQEEIDAVTEELTRAVGLGGRDRRAASAAERARLNVTRAVRSAIARIAASHPELGDHLQVTVRTGTFCSYQPDPAAAPSWDVSER